MLKRLAILAVTLLAAACSTPEAGDDCRAENTATCASRTEALFCASGKLRAVACRGAAGCVEGNNGVVCDINSARSGDGCPPNNENQAQCDVSDNNRALKCAAGVWVAQTCRSCAVQAGSVVCQP